MNNIKDFGSSSRPTPWVHSNGNPPVVGVIFLTSAMFPILPKGAEK